MSYLPAPPNNAFVPPWVQPYLDFAQAISDATVTVTTAPGAQGQLAFNVNGTRATLMLNLGPTASALNGLNITIAYTKTGGAGGTLTFTNGILTGAT